MSRVISPRLVAALVAGAAVVLSACGGGSAGDETWVDIRDRPELELYDNEHTTGQQIHLVGGQTADYTVIPPYGEEHSPIPQPCGAYGATPTFEMVVHAMEHGAVAIWYAPDQLAHGMKSRRSRRSQPDTLKTDTTSFRRPTAASTRQSCSSPGAFGSHSKMSRNAQLISSSTSSTTKLPNRSPPAAAPRRASGLPVHSQP